MNLKVVSCDYFICVLDVFHVEILLEVCIVKNKTASPYHECILKVFAFTATEIGHIDHKIIQDIRFSTIAVTVTENIFLHFLLGSFFMEHVKKDT